MTDEPDEALAEKVTLSRTESVCPICLRTIPAMRVQRGEAIYLDKTCAIHGTSRTLIWRGAPEFRAWVRPKTPAPPKHPFTEVRDGCPHDCGLCPDHRQQTCHALLEVTQRCDLGCPVCYANSGDKETRDPTLEQIDFWYQRILDAGGPYNIQLSGGEPCQRDDLAEIISRGREKGFQYFQLNTNGIRISREPEYLKRLIEAGLSSVFLQFDGTNDDIYRRMRGAALLKSKLRAIEACAAEGVGVVLVPTLVNEVNLEDVGNILDLALQYFPSVRGIHFQPISYFGRYPFSPTNDERLTLPDIMRKLVESSRGRIKIDSFRPPGCENALCSFHANFAIMPNGDFISLTHHESSKSCCSTPEEGALGAQRAIAFVAEQWTRAPNIQASHPSLALNVINDSASADQEHPLGEWDILLQRSRTHRFSISGMAFQDAWSLDLERLRDCCIHIVSPDGRLIPFCAYNLTSADGKVLYRTDELY